MKEEISIKHSHTDDHCCGAEENGKHTHKGSVHSHTKHGHDHGDDDHDHDHDHGGEDNTNILMSRWSLWLSLLILASFLIATYGFKLVVNRYAEIGLMLSAYLLAGYKTVMRAFRKVGHGDFFNEFSLMTIATFGAFYIGEFSEGVAVMIFYEIGELIQDLAVSRSRRSIKALLDIRPDEVTVVRNGQNLITSPFDVKPGEKILVKAGEKVALDGILISDSATFNTAALTGESKPSVKEKGSEILAGMINTEKAAEVEVKSLFTDSKLSRILEMVQDATARKAPTQLMVSKLAKIYTPIVFGLALLIILVPYLFVAHYEFQQWLYRGMVFLVIACPCALTISIPLGYFGGIGLASRNGILVKGSNFLDVVTEIDTLVSDKTGTLTKGVFKVQQVEAKIDREKFLNYTASLEQYSTHPVAKAVVAFADLKDFLPVTDVEEFAGLGLKGYIENAAIFGGNIKLMKKFSIDYPPELEDITETIVVVGIDSRYAGYLTIADEIKEDAGQAIKSLQALGIETIMLSGDKQAVTSSVARQLSINQYYGDLLPEDKVRIVQELKDQGKRIAFVGDGVNDAPVIALADVGIAMGGLGSDAAIETADIVIQNDQPSKIVSAIKAGKITKSIVYQNITLAMGIKVLVMLLGAGGIATLWEAVFADVGVALLAILNAFRIQGKSL